MRNEVNWYLQVPEACKRFLPTIVDHSVESGNVFLKMECLHLPSAHQLYREHPDSMVIMDTIFQQIQATLSEFSLYSAAVSELDLEEMYITKTLRRLFRWLEQCEWVQSIHQQGTININGYRYPCPIGYIEKEASMLLLLLNNPVPQLIHGDLCFSNLFIDFPNQQLFLIDPRGEFGTTGIYGDGRYDRARIRHSLSGYEQLISDCFTARLVGNQLVLELPYNPYHQRWLDAWDEACKSHLFEIRLIEALLFLSMIPLHADKPSRQMAMYGIGTSFFLIHYRKEEVTEDENRRRSRWNLMHSENKMGKPIRMYFPCPRRSIPSDI